MGLISAQAADGKNFVLMSPQGKLFTKQKFLASSGLEVLVQSSLWILVEETGVGEQRRLDLGSQAPVWTGKFRIRFYSKDVMSELNLGRVY